MAKSIKSTSSKSSIISTATASLKKTVRKSAKAVVRPLKKIRHSLSLRSEGATRSTASRASTVVAPSDNELDDPKEQSDADSGTDPELTLQQELGMLLSRLLCQTILFLTFHFRGGSKNLAIANLFIFQT